MTKRTLAVLALLLCLCLLPGAALARSATAAEPAGPDKAADAADEVVSAPVDPEVSEIEGAELWTEEIANAVRAGQDAQAQQAADAAAAAARADSVRIDSDSFDDDAFRGWLRTNVDGNGDGVLTAAERDGVTEIDVSYVGIYSLKGIELFANLAKLNCKYNNLTRLDVGACGRLEWIDAWNNCLTSIDVKNLGRLAYLDIDDNHLQALDISGCGALATVFARNSELAVVNASGCASLTADGLYLTKECLRELKLCGCDALDALDYSHAGLESLDVSRCANLTRLTCDYNLLSTLKVRDCARLAVLDAGHNGLPKIDLTGCPALIAASQLTPVEADGCLCFEGEDGVAITVDESTQLVVLGDVSPTAVRLNKTGTKGLARGKTMQLKATVLPADAEQDVRWISSKKAVATVDGNGLVTARRAGEAKITARTPNGVKASVIIRVYNAKPRRVKIVAETRTLAPGKSLKLGAELTPSHAVTTLSWTSSDAAVATVNRYGKVKAKKAGTVKITVTTANGKKASVKLRVKANPVRYRALLVAEEDFVPACTRNTGDVKLMKAMLNSVKGPSGGSYAVTTRKDVDAAGLFSAIDEAFGRADSNDVSLFFIATHGDSTSANPTNAGALCCLRGHGNTEWLMLEDLAQKLRTVPGKVIVILESCGSGAAVYGGAGEQNAAVYGSKAAAFDAAAIRAFSNADPGLAVDADGNACETGDGAPKLGDFRVENKFYVLTASRFLESSWGTEQGPFNYFTRWLANGIGTVGRMPADADRSGTVTLKELFGYISRVGDDHAFTDGSSIYYQHVQVYPKDSGYKLFKR